MAPLTRAACLTNYREVASASGLNPARMLLDAGLNPSVLDEPDLMIPVDAFSRLLQASAVASGNESFGLSMTRSRLLSNLGPVGLLMRDQATLRDALNMLMRYQTALSGTLLIALEERDGMVMIREAVVAGRHQSTRQRVELALGVMMSIIRKLVDNDDWQPRCVCFEHTAPRDLTVHTQVFGHAIEFGHTSNGIICHKADLDTRIPYADPAMARYAQKLINDTVQSPKSQLLGDLRRTILLLLPSGRCSIKTVSEHLGVKPRTVQRRLAEDDQSFSSLINDMRKELVTRYVLESDRSLSEVTEILGFATASSFSRWYGAQFGCSATASRALQA
ncbi:AraC family transcriptional regulator ligand-binding domain-containing protein [Acidovorax sp. Be4]|uniref:AraC family transcriptional regulator ligand-binding domain-containing protein n=1 Tax=Acidovorax bellezanensis TaxID=2976702 RepID=A0ABT2PKT9_9BURK|nr:AraC family transcriptional regulator [Acidovorax sp. Be4]MCT9810454.1 AraC family transcriptional regulator ligand-binding domain-containing protein [Acidovorax sp. Be4]